MSAEDERELCWKVINEDCSESRRRLVQEHLYLVVAIARRYQRRGLPLEALIQEGTSGLQRAVDDFDPDQGLRFSTHSSWWIKNSIRNAIMHTVAPPAHALGVRGVVPRPGHEDGSSRHVS